MHRLFAPVAALGLAVSAAGAAEARLDVLGGPFDGTLESVEAINFVVGADALYARGFFGVNALAANVEAGHVWSGHEVFARGGLGLPDAPSLLLNATRDPLTAPDLGDLDFHATMVGHVLAGTGDAGGGNLSLIGAGIAPLAELWSGAIATHFDRAPENIGSFTISDASFDTPYAAFFNGSLGRKPDVVNSSWGFSDPAGRERENRHLDALAAANPTVTLVRSAGNGGPTAAPGVGYNGIVVGGLGGSADAAPYLRPSSFTSSRRADFFNPVTGNSVVGARVAVSIAAPAEDLALAYYGGKSGSLADLVGEGNPATDLYFSFNQAGTSFSAPAVAGGVALLKDAAYGTGLAFFTSSALDTRVIKSVLQAGARPTVGWDNGQRMSGGVIVTDQALDEQVGAGALDLAESAGIYLDGTQDLPGEGGGTIDVMGWDFGSVAAGGANDYAFLAPFSQAVVLSLSLNWFVPQTLVNSLPVDQRFANLDLSVWLRDDTGAFSTEIARSATVYNNTEFLRLDLDPGRYGVRVGFTGWLYNLSAGTAESYALAWTVNPSAVPEPGATAAAMLLLLLLALAGRRRKLCIVEMSRRR